MYCVYQLQNDKNEIYFGMTKNVNKRWLKHMKDAREDGDCSSKKLWYDDNTVVEMHELEWFESKDDCHEREIYLIQNNNCVNAVKYDFDAKAYTNEYYENNKGQILQKMKEYRQQNKEAISQKSKEYRQTNKETIYQKRKEKIAFHKSW